MVHLFLPFLMLNFPQLPTMCRELCRYGDAEMNESWLLLSRAHNEAGHPGTCNNDVQRGAY